MQHFLACSTRAFAVLDAADQLHFSYPFGVLEITMAMDEPVLMSGASLSSRNFISGMFLIDQMCGAMPTELSVRRISLDFGGAELWSRTKEECAVLRFVLPPAHYVPGDLMLEIDVKDGDDIAILLEEVSVERVDCSEFSVTSITVGLADIPELDIKDGYLE
jgi:hypothetical protein